MPVLARTCLAHYVCVDEASAYQVSAAVRKCVKANLAGHELVNQQLTAVCAASPDGVLPLAVAPLSGVSRTAHPLLRNPGPSTRGDCQLYFSSIDADAGFDIT